MAAASGITTSGQPPTAVVNIQPGMNVQAVVLVDQNGQYVTPGGSSTTANSLATTTVPVNVAAATAPTSGQVLTATSGTTATWQAAAGGAPTGSAGGDLGSTYPNPTVTATHLASALPVNQGGTGSASRNFTGLMTPTAVKTSAYNAAAGDFIPVDTTSGSVTITLPTAPADLTVIGIKMVIQGSTNTVTFNCGGSDVFNKTGGATSGTLTLLSQGVILQYKASGAIWYVLADDLPLTQLDLRYLQLSGGTMSGAIAMGSSKITGLANGSAASDAAAYGQTLAGGSGAPMTTLGDLLYENSTPAAARLAGNTTGTKNFLTQTGTGSVSAAPAWGTIASADLPTGTTGAKGALQLDGTAGDIAALGAQAAGSVGKAADAGHVHPATGVALLSGPVFTGNVELAAGTTSLAPVTFQSGTNLTTATAGDLEYDGTCFYATAAASSRQVADAEQFQCLSGTYTLAANTSAQAILNATANGAVTLQGTTTYFFDCMILGTGFSSSSHTFQFGIGGTASFTAVSYHSLATASSVGGSASGFAGNSAAANAITGAVTGTTLTATIRGVLRINAGGTVIPQLTQLTAGAAASIQAGTYFRCWPAGSGSVTSVGNWS